MTHTALPESIPLHTYQGATWPSVCAGLPTRWPVDCEAAYLATNGGETIFGQPDEIMSQVMQMISEKASTPDILKEVGQALHAHYRSQGATKLQAYAWCEVFGLTLEHISRSDMAEGKGWRWDQFTQGITFLFRASSPDPQESSMCVEISLRGVPRPTIYKCDEWVRNLERSSAVLRGLPVFSLLKDRTLIGLTWEQYQTESGAVATGEQPPVDVTTLPAAAEAKTGQPTITTS